MKADTNNLPLKSKRLIIPFGLRTMFSSIFFQPKIETCLVDGGTMSSSSSSRSFFVCAVQLISFFLIFHWKIC